MQQYIVTKTQQIAIKAEDPEEVLKKIVAGEGISTGVTINVQLRPPPPPVQNAPGQQPTLGPSRPPPKNIRS